MNHVIIGAGPAAINAIETIRQFDEASSITLISDEPAYARMVLPYWLAERIPKQQVFTGDDAYFDRFKVTRMFGKRVASVDPSAKRIQMQDGAAVPFDELLIATGSSATIPPIPGANLPGVLPLWTLAHTDAVLEATKGMSQPEVVFIGAGFIGFIVLNAMYKRGWKLHVVEIAQHVLPRMLNPDGAQMVEGWLKKKNVGLHLGATAQEITAAGNRKRVKLSNGSTVEADLVIVATGIRPNLELVKDSGIQVDQGILVNNKMQTNFPFIYAAGDVAQGPDLLGGPSAVHAIQPTAVDHGRIAGANMAGQEIAYPGSLLMNILDVCGLQCASFGRWSETVEETTIANPDRPIYRKLLWDGDKVSGAVFLGPATDMGLLNDVGMVKGFIQTQTPFGNWKDFLKANPFDLRRPFVALQVAKKLVNSTLLNRPSRPREYHYQDKQPAPQVTKPDAHQVFVGNKG